MSNKINNLQFYTNSSILLLGITLTFIILLVFFPVFAGNYYYEIGTILIYSGPSDKIPKNFALCDGNNNTPDLRERFIIGAYSENDIPIVESINDDITYTNSLDPTKKSSYIGPGLKTSVGDQSTVSNDINVIPQAFAKGNIPYIFGTVYNSEVKTENNINVGATFFKNYLLTDKNNDNICNKLRDKTEAEKFTNIERLYSSTSTDTIDICNDDKTLLTDANMHAKQLDIIQDDNELELDYDYKYYVNTDLELSEAKNKEINESDYKVQHVPQYRNLFRDYEDYVLYLNGNKSHYNSLPVNLKFKDHIYKYTFTDYIKTPKENGYITNIPEYMNNFSYEQPYSNNPSYLKLAYIMRVK
tara:strand:+ start:744 stop:1817 length:1074 start_codon:yes stop_codon:yes gene_type:complete